ncbi:light-harvesting protein [Rhodobacter ferrooxidans]|uniref:Antenna pigment protein alpha chain n=1 Tax=Rhodobacter ferrooxidans TaxID=371731 RepID=C8RXU0_9RHOB|nr:light-harvesting protein [Rhodobacter sp. SW2]EEW26338.1 antenna complex alpha/beta subunit [Rhodobacter sp. SW2]
MTYGKVWLVVKPTVGIPAFLAGVAIASVFVHVMLFNNTTWLAPYYSGASLNPAAAAAPVVAAPAVSG